MDSFTDACVGMRVGSLSFIRLYGVISTDCNQNCVCRLPPSEWVDPSSQQLKHLLIRDDALRNFRYISSSFKSMPSSQTNNCSRVIDSTLTNSKLYSNKVSPLQAVTSSLPQNPQHSLTFRYSGSQLIFLPINLFSEKPIRISFF